MQSVALIIVSIMLGYIHTTEGESVHVVRTQSQQLRSNNQYEHRCKRHLGHQIDKCLQSFEQEYHIYQGSADMFQRQTLVMQLCHTYEETLQCLHLLLLHCKPMDHHLTIIHFRLGRIHGFMTSTCFNARNRKRVLHTGDRATPRPASPTQTTTVASPPPSTETIIRPTTAGSTPTSTTLRTVQSTPIKPRILTMHHGSQTIKEVLPSTVVPPRVQSKHKHKHRKQNKLVRTDNLVHRRTFVGTPQHMIIDINKGAKSKASVTVSFGLQTFLLSTCLLLTRFL